ncbi:hypothetical protein PVAND_008646 [Polypedilum vanderplanki]|uniref:CWF19-like protein n=1 Tax=Polypedilum vanderplanki TaxID=319348 RepID=A0A9J6CA85_POLVA|nr:hypothetical protein PVAND_008646 [Polypedilum vanderplanki]
MSSEKLKILICGDIESQFDAIFDKVRKLNKQSAFSFLICVGNFFSDSFDEESFNKYKSGEKTIPIPTYFLGPNSKEQSEIYEKLGIDETNNEVCNNLNYLGRMGVYQLSSGVTFAYLSGLEIKEGESKESFHFDKKDVITVKNSALKNFSNIDEYRGVDFLITSQWAYGINETENENSSKLISFLALNVKPRYHCCGLNNVHFEKAPFRFPAINARSIEPVSRFIALAKVNNTSKSKFLYALNITPLSMMRLTDLMLKSTDEIECPYLNIDFSNEIKEDKQEIASNAQFFWSQNDESTNKRRRHDNRQQNKRFRPMIDQDACWFCLQSKDIEKHLIISIGEKFYLALAKNPVSNYHVLIIPVSHIQAVSHIDEDLFNELKMFKKSIEKFFDTLDMCTVFFERNYVTSHSIVNAIGIPRKIEWQMSETLKDKAMEYNLEFESIPKVSTPSDLPRGPYFVIEWNDQTHITRSMKGFPINFGRDLVCAETLLNAEDKVDWRDCQLPRNLEDKYVAKFKEGYKPFNFNIDEEEDDNDE